MKPHYRLCALTALVALLATGHAVDADGIPDHPSKLTFPELHYEAPSPKGMRQILDNGIVLWWAEDTGAAGLPALFQLKAYVRSSSLLDPVDKVGLGEFTCALMREGGIATHSREKLNRELDLRAASLSTSLDENAASVGLTCLHRDREFCLGLFSNILQKPVFSQAEIDRVRGQWIESIKHRNDRPGEIEDREWSRLLYGEHPAARVILRKGLESFTVNNLKEWHAQAFQPSNIMLCGSGSLSAEEARDALNALLGSWESKAETQEISVPAAEQVAEPGIYLMQRDQAQAHVRVGHLSFQRDDKDYYALLIMNYILGGGSFSSRITQEVRVKNGLSYVSGSRFMMPEHYTGPFQAYAQTKNATAAYAAKLILREINRIRENEVSEEELHTAKQYYIGAFPQRFSTRNGIAEVYGMCEYLGRPEGYQDNWRARIEEVDQEDVLRVAKTYLQPDNVVIYILGDIEEIRKGNPDDGEGRTTTLEDLDLPVHEIPLPEPENLVVAETTQPE